MLDPTNIAPHRSIPAPDTVPWLALTLIGALLGSLIGVGLWLLA